MPRTFFSADILWERYAVGLYTLARVNDGTKRPRRFFDVSRITPKSRVNNNNDYASYFPRRTATKRTLER